jgi:hypothetical protein
MHGSSHFILSYIFSGNFGKKINSGTTSAGRADIHAESITVKVFPAVLLEKTVRPAIYFEFMTILVDADAAE